MLATARSARQRRRKLCWFSLNGERALSVSEHSALRAGFSRHRGLPIRCGFLKSAEAKPPRSVHRLDEPARLSLAWLRPRRARFRFARQVHFSSILAPPRLRSQRDASSDRNPYATVNFPTRGVPARVGQFLNPSAGVGSLRIRACLLEREQLKYFSGSVVALGTRTVFVADSFFMRHDLTIADMAEWPRSVCLGIA